MKRSTIVVLIILASIAFFFVNRYWRAANIEFSDVKVYDMNNEYASLSSLAKGPTIIHFYASWCGPCMKELPQLLDYAKTDGQNFNIILITDDDANKMHRVIRQADGSVVVRRVNSLKETSVYSIPATYFLNAEGKVVEKDLGEQDWANPEFRKEVAEMLQSK
jgi:thiol-disulfide isomerase/thioredoxin